MPNHWRTPLYFFALWKLGAVAVPFDREMNPDAAGRIVDSVAPRLLISGYGERPVWSERPYRAEWWEPGSERRDSAAATANVWTPPNEELAFIVFTSGTTGQPKGCMITHANLCSQIDAFPDRVPLDTTCRLAQHSAPFPPVRDHRRAPLSLLRRRGHPLHTQSAWTGHCAGAGRAEDHPHDRRAAVVDFDGPESRATA